MKRSHRITRLVLIGLAVLALAAPAASARPATESPLDQGGGAQIAIEPEPAPAVPSVEDGFDWGSAAIGAGIAGGVILLIAWGGVTYRHRHVPTGLAH